MINTVFMKFLTKKSIYTDKIRDSEDVFNAAAREGPFYSLAAYSNELSEAIGVNEPSLMLDRRTKIIAIYGESIFDDLERAEEIIIERENNPNSNFSEREVRELEDRIENFLRTNSYLPIVTYRQNNGISGSVPVQPTISNTEPVVNDNVPPTPHIDIPDLTMKDESTSNINQEKHKKER